jgi:hypothetical protein
MPESLYRCNRNAAKICLQPLDVGRQQRRHSIRRCKLLHSFSQALERMGGLQVLIGVKACFAVESRG